MPESCRGARRAGSDCSGYQFAAANLPKSDRRCWPAETAIRGQHVNVSLRTVPSETGRQSRSKLAAVQHATSTSSTATTTAAATPRRSTRCSTRRATSAARTKASSPSSRRRLPPSSTARAEALGPRVHRPGHHVLAVRPGAAVPAGPGAAGDLGRRVVAAGAGHHPAGQGAGDVPRRHLRRAGDPARRRHPAPAGHLLRALPPRGRRHRAAQRCAHPRRRHRPGPRRAAATSGCWRTTCAHRRGCPM